MFSLKRLSLITLVISAGLLATSAVAQVVITQAKANAGNVTAGDDPLYPIEINTPGSYVLGGNLTVPVGKNGIEINSFDVTIDFRGFRMHVSGAALIGILGNFDTATIKNGVIAGFSTGAIKGRSYWSVENMTIVANGGSGIALRDSSKVSSNIINRNTKYGIFCGKDCLIEGNVVTGNGFSDNSAGLRLISGTVLGNTITNNKYVGIHATGVVGAGNNTLDGNNNSTGSQVIGINKLQPNFCNPPTGC